MANDITLTQPDLINRLRSSLPADYTDATFKKPNAPFTTPSNTKWLRATVLPNATDNVTPDGYKRTFGIFTIDIFYPKGQGDRAQLADAKEIQSLFDNKEFGNTKTWSSSVRTIGEQDAWYLVQVDCEFFYEGV